MFFQSIGTKDRMKFFCHLKVCDKNFSRTTFVVKHQDYSFFLLAPVENYLFNNQSFPLLKLHKLNGAWHHEFESQSKPFSDEMLQIITSQLDGKLTAISANN